MTDLYRAIQAMRDAGLDVGHIVSVQGVAAVVARAIRSMWRGDVNDVYASLRELDDELKVEDWEQKRATPDVVMIDPDIARIQSLHQDVSDILRDVSTSGRELDLRIDRLAERVGAPSDTARREEMSDGECMVFRLEFASGFTEVRAGGWAMAVIKASDISVAEGKTLLAIRYLRDE